MKRKFFYLLMAVAAACAMTLASCGGDEPDGGGNPGSKPGTDNPYYPDDPIQPVETTIVGTWRCVEKNETVELVFTSEGTFTETVWEKIGGEELVEVETGSYYHDTRENRLRLNYYEEDGGVDTDYYRIELNSNVMTLTDEDGDKMVFHRVAESPAAKSILGSWSSTQGDETITLTFLNDGTFTEKYELVGKPDSVETYTGTYTYDAISGRLVMKYTEDGEVETYTAGVAGDTLTLRSDSGTETYRKV